MTVGYSIAEDYAVIRNRIKARKWQPRRLDKLLERIKEAIALLELSECTDARRCRCTCSGESLCEFCPVEEPYEQSNHCNCPQY